MKEVVSFDTTRRRAAFEMHWIYDDAKGLMEKYSTSWKNKYSITNLQESNYFVKSLMKIHKTSEQDNWWVYH